MTDDRCSKLTRAAFLMIKGSTADDITNKEELLEALQFAGLLSTFYLLLSYNPIHLYDLESRKN